MRRLIAAICVTGLLALSACGPPAKPPPKSDGSALLEDVRILSADDMQGRGIGTPGSAKARAYIEGRLKAIGVTPMGRAGYETPFSFVGKDGKTVAGVNLVGRIDGSDTGGKVMVVSAHYDHLGVKLGQVYNGADDNASGVAGLLAVAESFARQKPKHTVIFAVVDGEELGLKGAQAFVADPPAPLSRIALNVNFDMLGTNAKNELYASGGYTQPFLRGRLDALAKRAPVSLKQGHDTPADKGSDNWTEGSDHHAFLEKGVPWVYFGVEDHPEYHQPSDDFATVPQDFFKRSAATVVMAARVFDDDLDAIAKESGR